jgi:MFS family permease
MAFGSNLAGFLTVNIVLVNWFERQRARALSLGSMGQSVAGLLVPLVAWSLATYGWRATAVCSGFLVLAAGVPVAQLFRRAPEPYGYAPDGAPLASSPTQPEVADGPTAEGAQSAAAPPRNGALAGNLGMTAREALHHPSFWLLTSGHTAALVAVSTMTVLLIPYLVEQLNLGVDQAANVIAALTAMSVVGQLVGGYLGDRLEKRLISATCMVGHTLALVILLFSPSLALIVVGALVHGLAWGTRGPLMMAMRADYFGRRAFATIEGFAAIVTTAGLFVGPLLVGFIADQVGDYRPGFAVLSFITAAGFFSFFLARKPTVATARLDTSLEGQRVRA